MSFSSFSFQFTIFYSSIHMWFSLYWPTFVQCTAILFISPRSLLKLLPWVCGLSLWPENVFNTGDTREDRQKEHMLQFLHSDPSRHCPPPWSTHSFPLNPQCSQQLFPISWKENQFIDRFYAFQFAFFRFHWLKCEMH